MKSRERKLPSFTVIVFHGGKSGKAFTVGGKSFDVLKGDFYAMQSGNKRIQAMLSPMIVFFFFFNINLQRRWDVSEYVEFTARRECVCFVFQTILSCCFNLMKNSVK